MWRLGPEHRRRVLGHEHSAQARALCGGRAHRARLPDVVDAGALAVTGSHATLAQEELLSM